MNIEIRVSADVPRDEIWFVQPTEHRLQQEVTPDGDLRLSVVERGKVIGKIVGLSTP